jgi:formylglycine-generating enzyme required for sulfatase activity
MCALSTSRVLLAIIGKGWLNAQTDSGERRLELPDDWVRNEIFLAFKLDVPVIPVLVEGAAMPSEKSLPHDLRRLAPLQPARVRNDPDFDSDMRKLCRSVRKLIGHGRNGHRLVGGLAVLLLLLVCVVVARTAYSHVPEIAGLRFIGANEKSCLEYALADDPSLIFVMIPGGELKPLPDQRDAMQPISSPPLHVKRYLISKYELTRAQYFRSRGKDAPASGDAGANRPAVDLTWEEARTYCDWLSAETKLDVDLPNEIEWEFAARGETVNIYPWGDDAPDRRKTNYAGLPAVGVDGGDPKVGGTMPVGCFPNGVSPFGVHDMAGNAAEWCENTFFENIDPADAKRSSQTLMAVRGGSYRNTALEIRSTSRSYARRNYCDDSIGFRPIIRLPNP